MSKRSGKRARLRSMNISLDTTKGDETSFDDVKYSFTKRNTSKLSPTIQVVVCNGSVVPSTSIVQHGDIRLECVIAACSPPNSALFNITMRSIGNNIDESATYSLHRTYSSLSCAAAETTAYYKMNVNYKFSLPVQNLFSMIDLQSRTFEYDITHYYQVKFHQITRRRYVKLFTPLVDDIEASFHNNDDAGKDISFIVGGQEFRAHRFVVCARSLVLETLFYDVEVSTFIVENCKPAAFETFLLFLYKGELSDDDLKRYARSDLLSLAIEYDVPTLKWICGSYLTANLNLKNVLALLKLANDLGFVELKDKCIYYVMRAIERKRPPRQYNVFLQTIDQELVIEIYEKSVRLLQLNLAMELVDVTMSHKVLAADICNQQLYNTVDNITIEVKDATFSTSKYVLCARSSVFRKMLSMNMTESLNSKIQIDDFDSAAFKVFLDYLSASKIELDLLAQYVTELLAIAMKYDVAALIDLCVQYCKEFLMETNALNILVAAVTYDLVDLKSACTDFVISHSEEIPDYDAFLETTDQSTLLELLRKTIGLKRKLH